MGKLSNLFTQVRKARSGKGIGFVGKNTLAAKPRAAALLVELNKADAGNAEAAVKAGADGLIFVWKGDENTEVLGKAVAAAHVAGEDVLAGLYIRSGWEKLERADFEKFKESGLSFVILPLNAPARLLALEIKDMEAIVSVPMRSGELYPVFIRNLSAFDSVTAVHLDFDLNSEIGDLSIEDVLHYRAVREAIHAPALVNVKGVPGEDDAYALLALGIQAVVLMESKDTATTSQQIRDLHDLLEKVHQEDKEASKLGLNVR
ncbi:MAG TPA: hypothetical protein VGD98_15055 [Ktedonobacteraceae bacterium]